MRSYSQPDTVLIFRIGSLGDTLVALPAFHLIRQRYPSSHIVLLTNSPVDGGVKAAPSYQILMGSGLVDDYIEYPHRSATLRALYRLVMEIRKLRPSYCIYLMPQRTLKQRIRDAVFFVLAGLPRMQGIWPGRDGNSHLPIEGKPYHRESEASRLLRSIGYNTAGLSPRLFSLVLHEAERESIVPVLQELEAGRPFIALSVGAKVPVKDWGQDYWLELLALLQDLADVYALVFFGSADERERCDQLLAAWSHSGLNLCGRLNPRQSAAVLEHSALFVGHDSGPMHLASSVGIPSISIFAARKAPGIWFPYGNEDHVFYNQVSCYGCELDVCIEQQMKCIRSITPVAVAERVKLLVSRRACDGETVLP
jgi:ADP-heptose:LPS heptosyltransferase